MILHDLEKQVRFREAITDIEQKYSHKLNEPLVNYFTITETSVLIKRDKNLVVSAEIEIVQAFNEIN